MLILLSILFVCLAQNTAAEAQIVYRQPRPGVYMGGRYGFYQPWVPRTFHLRAHPGFNPRQPNLWQMQAYGIRPMPYGLYRPVYPYYYRRW